MHASPPKRFGVLIVDDDAVTRALVRAAIRDDRIECHEAKNGIEAVSKTRVLRPDVVLLDVMLPVMDGLSVFRTLRQDPVCGQVRFVILSGRAVEGALALARDMGAFATLKKPAKPRLIRRTVFSALGIPLDGDDDNDGEPPLFGHLAHGRHPATP